MALEGRGTGKFVPASLQIGAEKVKPKMSAEPIVADELYYVGTVCRTRKMIIAAPDEDMGRLCRVVGVVRQEWWRRPDMPEYKVRMLAFPVTAIRRASELQMVAER